MDDFRFLGQELHSFGATAAFGASMRTGAKIKRSEYGLPGGGSVIIGEDTYQPTQRQVSILPLDGVEPTPLWRRRILSWLQNGRGEMIVHNDPQVMRIAQFDAEGTWSTQDWPDGEIQMTMTLQPLAYDTHETALTMETTSGAASALILCESALPMPLWIRAEVISGTVTELRLAIGGSILKLDGMSLAAGQAVCYDAGSLIGDVMSLTIADGIGFGMVKNWAKLTAMPGDMLSVTAAGGEMKVTAVMRGRWPA